MNNQSQRNSISTDVAVIRETVRNIEKKIDGICVNIDGHDNKISCLEKGQGVLDTKISLFAIFLSALSIIASAIAGWLAKTIK